MNLTNLYDAFSSSCECEGQQDADSCCYGDGAEKKWEAGEGGGGGHLGRSRGDRSTSAVPRGTGWGAWVPPAPFLVVAWRMRVTRSGVLERACARASSAATCATQTFLLSDPMGGIVSGREGRMQSSADAGSQLEYTCIRCPQKGGAVVCSHVNQT